MSSVLARKSSADSGKNSLCCLLMFISTSVKSNQNVLE